MSFNAHYSVVCLYYSFNRLCKIKNDGELREEEVSKGLSNLGLSATGLQHTYLCLSVPVSDANDRYVIEYIDIL